MGFFNRAPKVVKEIHDGIWGHLVSVHKINVDTLYNNIRCVEKGGMEGNTPVTLVRVFKLSDVASNGITITGWETFDQHPNLILFEGYFDAHKNEAHLERRKSQVS